MDITQVPYNKLIGISVPEDNTYLLQLNAREEYTNHLGTVHAAALFALAEGSGAQLLLNIFPKDLITQVVPVLRKTTASYKKPAYGRVVSTAHLKNSTIENVVSELEAKKRSLLVTTVNLYDDQEQKVFTGDFEWFVVLKTDL